MSGRTSAPKPEAGRRYLLPALFALAALALLYVLYLRPTRYPSLLEAATAGNVREMARHLRGGADISTSAADDERGRTAMHRAVTSGQVSAVRLMLDAGADVNVRDLRGDTPLHWAAVYGYMDVLQVLLDAGADVTAANRTYGTTLQSAITYNRPEMIPLLLGREMQIAREATGGNEQSLTAAVLNGDADRLSALLRGGAAVNDRGGCRATPLQYAIMAREGQVVQALLAAGADPNARDEDGHSALHYAAMLEDPALVTTLLRDGVDPNAATRSLMIPLHISASIGPEQAVTLFLSAGANVNARDIWGYTPLLRAQRWGRVEIEQVLISRGAVNLVEPVPPARPSAR